MSVSVQMFSARIAIEALHHIAISTATLGLADIR